MDQAKHTLEEHKLAVGALAAAAVVAAAGTAFVVHQHHEASKQQHSHIKLHIKLISAEHLIAKDSHLFSHATSDPYIVFKQGHIAIKSTVKHKNLNPEWDETFELGILDLKEKLHVHVFDKNLVSDSHLGHAEVNLSHLTSNPEDTELKLHGDAGLLHSNHGKLNLKLWVTSG